ncbi:ATP-binding cassette domain-containing protein [Facklamia hominis]|nr:ATP-binding cassette domain-containing protein [Facklamia hominis]WPJ90509.1 ATP-binding cassette domain-containing protein [Facklamia hominis]
MMDTQTLDKIVQISNLKKYYNLNKNNEVKAIDDISFYIRRGTTFGLVGESGSGKTTVGKCLALLEDISGGSIEFNGVDITKISDHRRLKEYHKEVQMIFQDPYASLNPRMTVNQIISEGMKNYGLYQNKKEMNERVKYLLNLVGLEPEHATRYPKEFSGGQRQRIGIARALAVDPKFIIADEAISALDVSIQAQIINLLMDLKNQFNLTYLFIAHDLSMVKYVSDEIGVMRHGKLLEIGTDDEIYYNPLHPYSKKLLSAIPIPEPIIERNKHRSDYQIKELTGKEQMVHLEGSHYIYCQKEEVDGYKHLLI